MSCPAKSQQEKKTRLLGLSTAGSHSSISIPSVATFSVWSDDFFFLTGIKGVAEEADEDEDTGAVGGCGCVGFLFAFLVNCCLSDVLPDIHEVINFRQMRANCSRTDKFLPNKDEFDSAPRDLLL